MTETSPAPNTRLEKLTEFERIDELEDSNEKPDKREQSKNYGD
jgi:hypothetical protein